MTAILLDIPMADAIGFAISMFLAIGFGYLLIVGTDRRQG